MIVQFPKSISPKTKLGVYRFMDSEYVPGLLSGRIRIGNAKYYSLLEIVTGNKWIGDKEECVARGMADNISVSPDRRDPDDLRILTDYRITDNVPEGSTFTVQSLNIINQGNYFIWSASRGDIESLRATMSNPQYAQFAYDGCIEILNPEAFAGHILKHGMINGVPLRNVMKDVIPAPVDYTQRVFDIREENISLSPFVKAPDFKLQSEYRFAFSPHVEIEEDHLFIDFPDATSFLRRVFVNEGPKKANFPQDTRENPELIALLAEKLELINNRDEISSEEHRRLSPEKYMEKSKELSEAFEKNFQQNHFMALAEAYWTLRCRGEKDAKMDKALLDYNGAWSMKHNLDEYLYGEWQLRMSEVTAPPPRFERITGQRVRRAR